MATAPRLIAMVAGLAMLGIPPAGADEPKPSVDGSAGERASALWQFAPDTEGAGHNFAFAEVYQAMNRSEGSGIAVVGLGTCVMVTTKETGPHEMCRGSGMGHALAPGEFELSPLLDTAKLEFDMFGQHHRVHWRASGQPPTVMPAYGVGAGGGAAGARVAREAAADGEIFGYPLIGAASTFASINRGGGMGAAPGRMHTTDAAGVTHWVDDDGMFHLSFERPASR